jgi:hypothetical protein
MLIQAKRGTATSAINRRGPEDEPRNHAPGKEENNGDANQDWRFAAPVCIVDARPDGDAENDTDKNEDNQAEKDTEGVVHVRSLQGG